MYKCRFTCICSISINGIPKLPLLNPLLTNYLFVHTHFSIQTILFPFSLRHLSSQTQCIHVWVVHKFSVLIFMKSDTESSIHFFMDIIRSALIIHLNCKSQTHPHTHKFLLSLHNIKSNVLTSQ